MRHAPRLPTGPSRALPTWCLAVLLALAVAACHGPQATPGAASAPTDAVALLSDHLRDNDLQAFAHDAVPPALRPALAEAWRDGRTRWPLEELPFDHKIPGMLATLGADQADVRLRRDFDRQFANAHAEIRAASSALGLFGVKYLQGDARLSAEERIHYVQLVSAVSAWAAAARLGDRKRARASIARMTLAAGRAGIRGDADLRRLGMDESLRRLGPVAGALKDSLRAYDLDLDASLDAMTLSQESADGDRARVRMRYPLAGRTIDTVVALERIDGHWYLSDFVRHARDAAALPAAATPPQGPGSAPAATPAPGPAPAPTPAEGPATPKPVSS